MAISNQISRIQEARDIIREKEKDMGIVNSTESPNLTLLAERLDGITVVDNLLHEIDGLDGEYVLEPGYYKGGTISVKGQAGDYKLASLGTITPSTSAHVFDPSSYSVYGFSKFTVDKIPKNFGDITTLTTFTTSDKLLSNEQVIVKVTGTDNQPEAVRVTGTMTNNGNTTATLTLAKTFYTIPEGYHAGSGQVSVDFVDVITVTPTKSIQNISEKNSFLKKVVVNPIENKYQDVTNISNKLDYIGENVSFVNHNGTQVTGKARISENDTYYFNALLDNSFNIPNGLYVGSDTSTETIQIVENGNYLFSNWEQVEFDDFIETSTNNSTIYGYKVPLQNKQAGARIISVTATATDYSWFIYEGEVYVFDDGPPGVDSTITVTYSSGEEGSQIVLTDDLENALAAI